MERYLVKYTFVENGCVRQTAWSGECASREAAVRESSDWFGFERDGIEVLNVEVEGPDDE